MSKYKYTFFEGRGRGEITRLIFVYAGVDFEDVRVAPLDWRKHVASEYTTREPSQSIITLSTITSAPVGYTLARYVLGFFYIFIFISAKKFNEAPLLEVDGVTLCQSNAIAHFVARRLSK